MYFENEWHCNVCGKKYNFNEMCGKIKNEHYFDSYNFCTDCGNPLHNEVYEHLLRELETKYKSREVTICENCDRVFDEKDTFCPICGKQLKKIPFIRWDRKNNYLYIVYNEVEENILLNKKIFLEHYYHIYELIEFCIKFKEIINAEIYQGLNNNYEPLTFLEILYFASGDFSENYNNVVFIFRNNDSGGLRKIRENLYGKIEFNDEKDCVDSYNVYYNGNGEIIEIEPILHHNIF